MATFFKVLAVVVMLITILLVYIFFSFQKYIVYTADGQVRLDIPFLRFLYEDENSAADEAFFGYGLVFDETNDDFSS